MRREGRQSAAAAAADAAAAATGGVMSVAYMATTHQNELTGCALALQYSLTVFTDVVRARLTT